MANGTILNKPPIKESAAGEFEEVGTSGIESWSGMIQQAYHTELTWPTVWPLYKRLWRNDAEIAGIVRPAYTTFASKQEITITPPTDPTDDDLALVEFTESMLDEIEGGMSAFIETMLRTAFFGWSWYEVVLGLRDGNEYDGWVSRHNDGLPAIRKLAHRDNGSFVKWAMDDATGKLFGMVQNDPPNTETTIPLDRSIHITFGDPTSPEGLSPLEAVWRLGSIKKGIEIIFGIGAEHTAGHLKVSSEQALGASDKNTVDNIARAALSAQEGNYILTPPGIDANIIDTPFSAAAILLDAIKYYGMSKLQVYNMQHMAMSTTSGTGSFAAMSDSSSMAVMSYNGMMEGFMKQVDTQLHRFYDNPQIKEAFPNTTGYPTIGLTSIEKSISLTELSQFAAQMFPIMPMGDDDLREIRRRSGFLPESLPILEDDETGAVSSGTPQATVAGISSIIDKVRDGSMTEVTAIETMIFIGLPRSIAEKLVDEAKSQPTAVTEPNDDAEMSVKSWWGLRADIYKDRSLPQDNLIDMLDNAKTDGDLDYIKLEMAKHGEASRSSS